MKIKELKEIVPDDTFLWIESEDETECFEADEKAYLSEKYDEKVIKYAFPERYPAYGTVGLTIRI